MKQSVSSPLTSAVSVESLRAVLEITGGLVGFEVPLKLAQIAGEKAARI